ncbi:DUF1835 domain-containing protein [Roseibium algae]|uniref:DUF1835 domain-containing protein n=1 Tax=Roseibium algae TaxID=3123038 RepID=A0ABU8TMZ3_9HYPH
MTDETPHLAQSPLFSETDLSLNLDRQKQRAKVLRNEARAGNAEALARLSAHHIRYKNLDTVQLKLADAQFVIAREAGLPSWPALKAHVEQMDAMGRAIQNAAPAPDADMSTLHIRCGNDIEAPLKRAGFLGDFLQFSDPVCQGPISDEPNAITERARFIASEYPGEDETETIDVLTKEHNRLNNAGDYGRIVLWFEHDPYDQLLLVKTLVQLKATGANRRKVELVSLDRFPGIQKFIGIGQLSPAALRHMYARRAPISEEAYNLAEVTFSALLVKDPEALHALSRHSSLGLPYLAGALSRYLSELPDVQNGLSFTENSILKALKDKPLPWGQVFRSFMQAVDPLPFHGDLMFLGTMLRLRDAERPALTSQPVDMTREGWGRTEFSLTETGLALLARALDWKTCGSRLRFQGSITCFADPDWRWDPIKQIPVAKC